MRHEHAACAPVELLEIGETAAGSNSVLQHTPEAFSRIEMVTAAGWEELQPKAPLPMGERRGECVRPVDATAIDDHHDLFAGCTEGGHHLMDILPKSLGIKLRDNFIEDF